MAITMRFFVHDAQPALRIIAWQPLYATLALPPDRVIESRLQSA